MSVAVPTCPFCNALLDGAAAPGQRVVCPRCGGLLDVAYDWDRVRPPRSLREFEAKWSDRANPLSFSGVWRFRELLPFMEGSTPSGSDAQRAAASAALYINYMNQNVFQPVGVSGADCKPPAQLNPAFASVLMLAGRIPKMRSSAGEMAKIEKTTTRPTNRSAQRNYDRFTEYSDCGQ